MKKLLFAALLLIPSFAHNSARAEATLSVYPDQSSFQFDAAGNLTFGLIADGVVTTAETCRMKFILATNPAPLNKGKIKNAANNPEGALMLFSLSTPAGLPNSVLRVDTTELTSKPKKGTIYGRAALQCGTKKKTFVFSPIVSFDYSLMTDATAKAAPQVARDWRSKTVASY